MQAIYRLQTQAQKLVTSRIPFPKPVLFSGSGAALTLIDELPNLPICNLLVITDQGIQQLGLLQPIEQRLAEHHIAFHVFANVQPDPSIDAIEACFAQLPSFDAVLAVGGGSVLDFAKVIAAKATSKVHVSKLVGQLKLKTCPLPLFTIPTTAGTGSETTIAAVVSDTANKVKLPILDPRLCPMFAALDPDLMLGLPAHITAATGLDALTHAVEAYLSDNSTAETDLFALTATKLISQNLYAAYQDGANQTARTHMAKASFYAGIAFTKAGVGYVHGFAHNLGAHYHIPHGLANALMLPPVLEYYLDTCATKLARLAAASGLNLEGKTEQQQAQAFIDYVKALKAKMQIGETIKPLRQEDIPAIAKAALKEAHGTYAVPKYLTLKQAQSLLISAAV